MPDDLFLERVVTVDGQEVACRFYKPRREDIDFSCRFEIGWPEGNRSRRAFGVDDVQAFLLALQMAHTDLLAARENERRQVLWLGERDLGLPTAETLRDWGPQKAS